MYTSKFLFIMLIFIGASTSTNAEVGCMTISQELAVPRDPKALHYVACTCPCQRYKQIADRNTCTKCGHFHDIKPYIIVTAREIIDREMSLVRQTNRTISKNVHKKTSE